MRQAGTDWIITSNYFHPNEPRMGVAEIESKETETAETEEKTKRRRKSKNCIKNATFYHRRWSPTSTRQYRILQPS